jgi:hypothetical protein
MINLPPFKMGNLGDGLGNEIYNRFTTLNENP